LPAEEEYNSIDKSSLIFPEEDSKVHEPVHVQTYQKSQGLLDHLLTEEDSPETIEDIFNSNPDDFVSFLISGVDSNTL